MGCGSAFSSLGSPLSPEFGSNLFGEALGTRSSTQRVNPNWYDPLGPSTGRQQTGAIPLRTGIFNQFKALGPTISNNSDQTAAMLRSGANDPGWAGARQLATDQINGKYLNGSPQLDQQIAQMRGASNAETANQDARTRSNFALNGMNFGTANEQAQQSNQALNTANANNTEAQTRLQNYQGERGIQQAAPAMLDQSIQSPANYLAAIPNQYLAPLSQEGQVISGLAGGGTTAQPDTLVRPGAGTELMGGIGSL